MRSLLLLALLALLPAVPPASANHSSCPGFDPAYAQVMVNSKCVGVWVALGPEFRCGPARPVHTPNVNAAVLEDYACGTGVILVLP